MWLVVLFLWSTTTLNPSQSITLVGQTIALTGPMGSVGIRVNAGIALAFQEANDNGVLKKNISLLTLDDGGDGAVAVQNIQQLNATYNPLFYAGVYGNGPFEQVVPLMVQSRIPLVGPIVGLSNARTPFRDVVFNLRPSYRDELVAHGRFLVEYLRLQRIACSFADDAMGVELYNALVDTLTSVGISLVAWASFAANGTATEVAAAVDTILRAQQKPQAVVLLGRDVQVAQFVVQYQLDPRASPNCTFMLLSDSATPELGALLGAANWPSVLFTRTVPPAGRNSGLWQSFQRTATQYRLPADYITGQPCFEGYIIGRFITQVADLLDKQGTSSQDSKTVFKRWAFLDRVYSTQLQYLDDMMLGLFGDNASGCADGICHCNSGMRRMYMATLDAVAGVATRPEWPVTQYPITQCQASADLIRRPVLFGVLIPTGDPLISRIARDIYAGIKSTFALLNAEGGLNGRQCDAVAAEYSGDPAGALAALMDRWPLVALLGCVVAGDTELPTSLPRIGTVDLVPRPAEPGYAADDLRTQATTPFELLALASYVVETMNGAVHFRVRRGPTSTALLGTITTVVNTLQAVPASAAEFDAATPALDGLSTGFVIGIGNATDLLAWLDVLKARPALTLLTTLPCVLQLMATGAVDPNATVLRQVLFPAPNGGGGADAFDLASFAQGCGATQAVVVAKVLSGSPDTYYAAYTTPQDMVAAWYNLQTVRNGSLVLGPYYSANCTGGGTAQCQCNLGVRSAAVVSLAAVSDVAYQYQSPTCNVVYKPLRVSPQPASSPVWPIVVGAVLGAVAVLVILAWLLARRRRNNWAAPKDPLRPFCVLFTDIQASTTLWASLPNDMAEALDAHHRLIRNLIQKYHCYEVKTIGDSFMCAAKSPAQALRFALAVQRAFHTHDWGTAAIDQAYDSLVVAETKGPVCWNGLRVRVGIHFGLGDVRQDPVSHGYDYYGTVVNTAARIESACHGGQVVVSEAVHRAVGAQVAGAVWADLGPHTLRGLLEPVQLYQVLPEGVLAQRRFPPLRAVCWDPQKEELQEDLEGSFAVSSPSNATTVDNWAEVHPLVQKGDSTAEELRRHYSILQTGLCALLASQVKAARQQMVRQLCERMHVPDHGAHGPGLMRSVHVLVMRVLPATVVQSGPARHNSVSSQQSSFPTSPVRRNGLLGLPTSPSRSSLAGGPRSARLRSESGDVSLPST